MYLKLSNGEHTAHLFNDKHLNIYEIQIFHLSLAYINIT
jgi:hypothetical protein